MAGKKKIKQVSPEEEAAILEFIHEGNKSAAYAKWVKDYDNPATRWNEAYRFFRRDDVKAREAELREKISEEVYKQAYVTRVSLTQELEEARILAKQEGVPSAMISATKEKARLHQFIDSKQESKEVDSITINIDG